MNELSIIKIEKELNTDGHSDITVALLKSLATYVPKFGPILANVIGIAIPNQKMDRLISFIKVLGDRMNYVEEDIAKLRMETPEFADLFEDGLIQASRALTDERRQNIAALLSNSLTDQDLAHLEQKKLLWLLVS
jgi:hypothetical protein